MNLTRIVLPTITANGVVAAATDQPSKLARGNAATEDAMTYYPQIGSVSEGTMLTEDLLDTFAGELSYHMKRMRLTRDQRKRFNTLLLECREFDDAEEYVSELFDALDEIAPPYCYFGAAEGDGASYGFWPAISNYDGDACDLPRLVAGDAIAREHWGEDVLLVNDHGNVECGHVTKRGVFKPYWSIV